MSREVLSRTLTLITSAFGFVAALAWNEAIQKLITSFFPQGSNLISMFFYAFLITIIAVIITMRLAKVEEKIKPK